MKTKNKSIKCRLLNGKRLAEEILIELRDKIRNYRIKAKIATILIGNNPASEVYVKKKEEKCKALGIDFELIRFKENVSKDEIKMKIEDLNVNKETTGILIQLPLPKNFERDEIINTILPDKDIDGLTSTNKEKLAKGDETLACCTAKGIIKLLEKNKISLRDKKIVIVGYGYLVGQPLSLMLKNRKLKFTICDDRTKNLKEETKKADVLISATGVPYLIKEDYVKEGVIVIDAGIAKLNDKVVGDVDFEGLKKKASWITPVPGGIGPMTVAMVIENILEAYQLQMRD